LEEGKGCKPPAAGRAAMSKIPKAITYAGFGGSLIFFR
jgi:hypothetical protein